MVERAGSLRFELEAAEPVGVDRERFGEHLESDIALEPSVTSFVDFAHSARTDGGEDLVRAEKRAWVKRHENRRLFYNGTQIGEVDSMLRSGTLRPGPLGRPAVAAWRLRTEPLFLIAPGSRAIRK